MIKLATSGLCYFRHTDRHQRVREKERDWKKHKPI